MSWQDGEGAIPSGNILEYVTDPQQHQLYTGGTATSAWTIAVRTSFAGGNRFVVDAQSGRLTMGEASTGENGFHYAGTWHDIDLFPVDNVERVYFLVSSGSAIQAYRNNVAVGIGASSTVDFAGTIRWKGVYLGTNDQDWSRPVVYAAAYNIALDATQRSALLLSMGGPSITTPQPYQIYQRNGNDVVDIPIVGTYIAPPAAIEARFNGGIWTVIDDSPSGGAFNTTLDGQSSGQGLLEVRFTDSPVSIDTVANVSVGDVMWVSGQSNAAGFADNNQVYSHATLKAVKFSLEDTEWSELTDPATTDGHGSPWPLLATLMMAYTGVPVGFITTAVNGTGIIDGDWSEGGAQYDDAVATLTASGVNTVLCGLFHQGENEMNLIHNGDLAPDEAQQAYYDAASAMWNAFQADLPSVLAGVKLVMAQVGYKTTSSSTRTDIDPIRAAQIQLWNENPDILAGPVTYDVGPHADGVHFGSGGNDANLQTLANRWWRMLRYHYFAGTDGRAPAFVSATRNGTTVLVVFANGIRPFAGRTDLTGWRYTVDDVPISIVSAEADGDNRVLLLLNQQPQGIEAISFGSGNDGVGTPILDSGTYPMPPEPFTEMAVEDITVIIGSSYDDEFDFYVDAYDLLTGAKLGSGPLSTVGSFRVTWRFDRLGEISFPYSAVDAQAAYIANRVGIKAYARLNGNYVEVGNGRIDTVEADVGPDGHVTLNGGGMDLMTELMDRSVGPLEVGRAVDEDSIIAGATHAAALTAISAFAPAGWTFTPAAPPDNDYIYARFDDESVLAALIAVAEKTQTHFVRHLDRQVRFSSAWMPSGLRAIQANGRLAPETCAIVSINRIVDTRDLLTRIRPYGSGTGTARLTLAATTRTAPAGYTLNKTLNYIQNDAAVAIHGMIDTPSVTFSEITPISNTDPDVVAAANMLFDSALKELKQRSTRASQQAYSLIVSGCSRLLKPLQTIWVDCVDVTQNININQRLYILEVSVNVEARGIPIFELIVSTDDRWPDSDEFNAADTTTQGKVFRAHPQMGPNALALSYSKPLDSDEVANFRFRLGKEIVTLQQVVFDFEILSLESTVKSIGGASSGSGELDTTVPSTNTSGNPSNDTSGVPSTNTSGNPSPDLSSAASGNTGSTSGNTGSTSGATGSTAGATNAVTGATGSTSGATGSTSGSTGGSGTLETDEPQGGDIVSGGQHGHGIVVQVGAGSLGNVTLHSLGGGNYELRNATIGSAVQPNSATLSGDHTHEIGGHTHSVDSHTHTVDSHAHSVDSHAHSVDSHSHSVDGHTHTVDSHMHTLGNHNHDLGGHTHTLNNHNHSLSNHTHSLSNHIHDLSEAITAFYGIFRETVERTYTIDQLEYSVNGGAWLPLSDAEDTGGGWYSLDITEHVMSAIFRPLQANNHLSIRAGMAQLDIESWDDHITYVRIHTSTAHGFAVGQWIEISGADLGAVGNSSIDGIWQVTVVDDSDTFHIEGPVVVPVFDFGVGGGIASAYGTASIDAQLTIRSTIQAVAYTS